MKIAQLKFDITIFKFAIVGVLNTGLTIAVIFLLKYFFAADDVFANFIGYVLGLVCSYFLNKKWTFNHSGEFISTAIKFLIVFAVSYSINVFFLLQFIKFGVNDYAAHLLGMPIYTLIFYFGSKYFVYLQRS